METRRDAGIDLVRAFAMFGVLLIHTATAGLMGNPVGSLPWWGALFWGSVSRAAVPLFLMCTGALFLRPERPCPPRRILTHNLPRIALALFAWALIYQLVPFVLRRTLTWAVFGQAVLNVLLFRHESHLYYLHIVLLVYLCLPLLQMFTAHASRRRLRYALGLWAFLGVVYPQLLKLPLLDSMIGVPVQAAVNLTWGSLGYALLGHALRRAAPRPRWLCPLLWAAGLALTFGGTAALSLQAGETRLDQLQGMSPGVALMAAGCFGVLSHARPGPRLAQAAQWLAGPSFCVYLAHPLCLTAFSSLGLSAAAQPWWQVPALALAALAGCLPLWAVLRRVPFIRDWLI